MSRHFFLRIVVSLPVVLGVLLLGFLLLQVVPTDPATTLAGPTATQDVVAAIRAELGLDEPILVQFLRYLARVLHGDLGRSIISNLPVTEELGATLPPTVELLVASLGWAIPTGIALGTLAAVKRGKIADRLIMAIAVAGLSMPVFWFGLLLIQQFGMTWQIFPFTGRAGPFWTADGAMSLVLPAVTLGGVFIGPVARMTRGSVLEVLSQDFVRTARAKGLREARVVIRHALRNALIPVVTLVGLQCGYLLGGAVITETLFAWPGVGRLAVGAILAADFPLAQGTIILLSLGFIVINLLVDLAYAALDPRIARA